MSEVNGVAADASASVPAESLQVVLARALNGVSAELGSGTPDFVLGEFLATVLGALDRAVGRRDGWYGVDLSPAGGRRPVDAASARGLIKRALGEVSLCWDPAPVGVFDSGAAAQVLERLLLDLGLLREGSEEAEVSASVPTPRWVWPTS